MRMGRVPGGLSGARAAVGQVTGPPAGGRAVPALAFATVPGVSDVAGLSVLGSDRRGPIEHVECFPAPPTITKVRFSTDEVTSLCPVTGQPDISSVEIEYEPDRLCIESKSLKLYLWSFRDRPVFAEALAAEIAAEVDRKSVV